MQWIANAAPGYSGPIPQDLGSPSNSHPPKTMQWRAIHMQSWGVGDHCRLRITHCRFWEYPVLQASGYPDAGAYPEDNMLNVRNSLGLGAASFEIWIPYIQNGWTHVMHICRCTRWVLLAGFVFMWCFCVPVICTGIHLASLIADFG